MIHTTEMAPLEVITDERPTVYVTGDNVYNYIMLQYSWSFHALIEDTFKSASCVVAVDDCSACDSIDYFRRVLCLNYALLLR